MDKTQCTNYTLRVSISVFNAKTTSNANHGAADNVAVNTKYLSESKKAIQRELAVLVEKKLIERSGNARYGQ